MPPNLRPLANSLASIARPLSRSSATQPAYRSLSTSPTHQLSYTPIRRAGGHESHYDPPTGWLWGVPPGQKAEKEGWEAIWTWGFFGSVGVLVVGYCFKPDTSIQTWALEEARRRLEAEGILKDPGLLEGDPKAQTTE